MAIDSRDKRASCIGIALPFLAVLPEPAGAVAGSDRAQLTYAYRLLDLAGVTVYIRQATDVALVSDTIFTQRFRTRQLLEATGLVDLSELIRVRQATAVDTLELTDSVLRFIELPGVTIIIRQVTDTIGLADALAVQRFVDRIQSDAVIVFDIADWTRLRQHLVTEGLTVNDALASWCERNWSATDVIGPYDTFITERTLTRSAIESTSIFDQILRFYYPVVMNYQPIQGIRVGAEIGHEARFRTNFLGLVVGGMPSSIGRSRGGLYPMHSASSRTTKTSQGHPLGVQVEIRRITKGGQRRPV